MHRSGRSLALLQWVASQRFCKDRSSSTSVGSLSTWAWASSGVSSLPSQRQLGNSSISAWPSFQGSRSFQTSTVPLAEDYYDILGVKKSASESELKKAYYKLAKQYHPDTNKGNKDAEKKFQDVSKAYDTLRDPQKRSIYDQVGPEGMDAGAGAGGNPFAGAGFGFGGAGGFNQGNAQDLFDMLFGNKANAGGMGGGMRWQFYEDPVASGKVGHDIQTRIKVSFEEAAKGGVKTFTVKTKNGPKTISMPIPAGAESGQTFQVNGQGAPAKKSGGRPGNLLVTLDVQPHRVLRQHDYDIHVDVNVQLSEALLGTTLRIPTLDGDVEIKLQPGARHRDQLRLDGKGIKMEMLGLPHRGDQIVHIKVDMPRNLTARQRELIEEFQQEEQSKGEEKKAKAA